MKLVDDLGIFVIGGRIGGQNDLILSLIHLKLLRLLLGQ